MTITLPLPSPPVEIDRRSSRVLSSAGEFRSGSYSGVRVNLPPAASAADRISRTHDGGWKSSIAKKTLSASRILTERDLRRGTTEQEKRPLDVNRHKQKNEKTAGAVRSPARPQHGLQLPHFTANNTGPKHRIRPSDRSAVVKHTAETHIRAERRNFTTGQNLQAQTQALISDRQGPRRRTGTRGDTDTQPHNRHENSEQAVYQEAVGKDTQAPHHLDGISQEQQAVKRPNRNLKRHQLFSEDPSIKVVQGKAVTKLEKWEDGSRCRQLTEQDFPGDNRRIRAGPGLRNHPWFSQDDIDKMELLAGGEVESKARVPSHGRVLQVALEPRRSKFPSQVTGSPQKHPDSHGESCQQGHCALIKRTDDWFEVFAFHLDRVLGLNRSLPAVLRTFHSEILPYRFTGGMPRPVVWWDPDIQHLDDTDNDQNSMPLGWVQYQQMLQLHCGSDTDLRSEPCVGVRHSEWGRLALFDFLLQVNDRLDRYCCGFTPDPTDVCVENLLQAKCQNAKELLLVHILVRKTDPSRLVFIDNAGRPRQSADNLNFRLVEGIQEFPEKAVSVLRSGCLESRLLRSLYTDKEFWDTHGGVSGLRPLIETVALRGKILLQHIRDRKLQLRRDL